MQQRSFLTAAILACATQVSAFTNGSLVPSYICNPTADGLPKAFAQLLPYTRKNAQVIAVDATAGDNKNIPLLKATGNSQIGNSAYILASFHDSLNNLNAQKGNGINVKTANGGPIIAGQANQLTLTSAGNNVQLLGVLAYANGADGTREGSFTDQGNTNTFVQFPGCGTNKQGGVNGIIQQTGVSATNTYTNLFYNADPSAAGTVTLAGLSVTKNGFGVWNFTLPVQAAAGGAAATGGTANAATGNTGGTATGAAAGTGAATGTGATAAAGTSAAAKSTGGKKGGKKPCNKTAKKFAA